MRAPLGAPEPDAFAPTPSLGEAVGAAFRANNPIVSTMEAIGAQSPNQRVDPAYNPMTVLKGTPQEQDPGRFVDDPNESVTRARLAQIQQEQNDRDTLSKAGFAGTVAGLASGILDPSFYVPLIGELHGAEAGASFLKGAGHMATVGALQSTTSELALQASQESRSWKESAGNIGTNTLLMGLLGGALGHLSSGERSSANDALEGVRRDATPANPLDPSSMSLQDHITPGMSGLSQGVEARAAELHTAGIADPADALEAAHVEAIPTEIANEAYGSAAQKSVDAFAERGGAGDEPDPTGALGEPGTGLGSTGGPGVAATDGSTLGSPAGTVGDDAGAGYGLAATITGDELAPLSSSVEDLRDAAKSFYEKNIRGTSVFNNDLGQDIEFRNARKSFSASADPDKLKMFAALPDIVERGRLIASRAPDVPGLEKDTKAYHYLRASVGTPDGPLDVHVTVREDSNGRLYYNHAILDDDGQLRRASQDTARKAGPVDAEAAAARGENIAHAADGINMTVSPKAVGADIADRRDLVLKPYGIDQVKGVRAVNAGLSPNLRIYTNSLSIAAKRAAADLAETALRFTQHDHGLATAGDGALETRVRLNKAKFQTAAHDILQSAYVDHRYGGKDPGMVQRARDAVSDLRGQTPAGTLSYKDFKSAVYDAMYSGDQHPVPQVAQAAKDLRAKVFDPVAKMAKDTLGPDGRPMLGDELSPPKGDQSFVPRMWNHGAAIAKRFELHQRITNWLDGQQSIKAAAKERIGDLQARHEAIVDQIAKLDRRMESLAGRAERTSTQLDERAMEANATSDRGDALVDRAGIVQDKLWELDDFIDGIRGQLRDPDTLQRLDELQREASQLRQEAAPISEAELKRLERGEIADVLPGDLRKGAEAFLGKRRLPDRPSFVTSLIQDGGVNDIGGDIRSMVGGTRTRPGLINSKGKTLDQIGEALQNEFGHIFLDRPSVSDVADLIDNSLNGKDPSWWLEHVEPFDSSPARIREFAGVLREFFESTGQSPKNLRDIAEALKSDRGDLPAILERLQNKVAAGRDLDAAMQTIEGRKAAFKDLRDLMAKSRDDKVSLRARERVANARAAEAGVAANRNRGRLSLLQDRLWQQQTMQDLLERARQNAEDDRAAIRGKMEDEVRGWQGDTTADAVRALKVRDEAERVRGLKREAGTYQGDGARLTGADAPVDRAVKQILASDRDLTRPELAARANEIIDRIIGSPDGRLPYDAASGGPSIGFTGGPKQEVRGSLKSRDFAIPTNLVKDFVHTDMEHVTSSFLRTMLPDIELTRRFGDVDMTDTFRRIADEYSSKVSDKTTEAQARKLNDQRDADMRDIAAMRDRLRGVYGWNPDPSMRKLASIVRDFHGLTSLGALGTSVANRFNDLGAQAVFRYGMSNVFNDAWRPFFKSMLRMSSLAAEAKRQAAEMGVGLDGLLGHLRHNLSDINDNYLPGNKYSRGIAWANDRSMLVNLHGPWTDWMKAMAWVPAQAEFGRIADRIAAGKATQRDLATMADANIPPEMATRISQQIGEHSTTVDGVRLASTDKWTDTAAREAFERAMSREANINVITAGIGDKPLFLSKPLGGLIGQFKSFVAGAHERILISNLQQRDGRSLQGMLTAMAMGMVSYRLYTLLSGQQASDRPQDWIKEGLARSALTGWLNEANNTLAKFTAGKLDYNRLYGADRPLSRRTENSPLSELLGPTYARLEGLSGIVTHVAGGHASAADIHQLRQALPLQNLMGLRIGFDDMEDGVSNALGFKPRNRTPTEWAPGTTPYPVQ